MRTLRGVDRSLSATPPTTLGDMLPPIAYFSDITWNILEDVRGRSCSFNGFLTLFRDFSDCNAMAVTGVIFKEAEELGRLSAEVSNPLSID